MKQAMINYMKKDKFDNLYTPPYAVYPLLKYLPKDKIYWECAGNGNSNITNVLLNNGYNIIENNINDDGIDYLKDVPSFDYDITITNPPYSLKNVFLERAFSIGKPFCFLLPLTSLEGIFRGKLFRKYGISVIVLDRRIDFSGKGSNWFNTSWFCYNIIENNTIVFEEVVK